MKKGLRWLVIGLLLIINVTIVYAVTTDTKAPTISKIEFKDKKESYAAGDKVYLNTDAKDDVSGIKSIYLWTSRITLNDGTYYGNSTDAREALSVLYDNGKPYVIIPNGYINGNYYVNEIYMVDNDGNESYYYTTDYIKYAKEMYDAVKADGSLFGDISFDDYLDNMTMGFEPIRTNISLTFNIVNENDNTKVSKLKSIKFNKEKVNYNDIVNIELDLENNAKMLYVILALSDGSSLTQYADSNDVINFSYNVTKTIKPGVIYLRHVILEDEYGNMAFYYTSNKSSNLAYDYYEDNSSIYEKIEDYSFEIIDDGSYVDDKEAPVLDDVKINKLEFPVPSFAKIEVKAHDNVSLAKTATVIFRSDNKELFTVLNLDEDGIYRGELEINQYAELGTYKLVCVVLSDESNNSSTYMNYKDKYKTDDLDIDLSFKLTSKFVPDVTTSTIAKDVLDKIKNAKDGAKIAIDATKDTLIKKEVFEAIAGTDKTIFIEANGIEWVFNGKEIKNPKDIDVLLNIYYDYNYSEADINEYVDKALVLDFFDNGELPGIATVRIKLDYALRDYIGENVYVYYYDADNDENKYFSVVSDGSLGLNDNGWFEFKISHNSTYLLSTSKPNEKYVSEEKEFVKLNETEDSKKDNLIYIVICSCLLVLIVIISVLIYMKKIKENK